MSPGLFEHPQWQPALLALLLLALSGVAVSRLVARRRARRLLGPRGRALPGAGAADAVLLAAVASLGLALLGPRLGERTVWARSSGVDVVVLLDVSASMTARDVPPSRLLRAREAARRILEALPQGDRAALAAFSGRGVLLTPLTPDTEALRRMLPALTPDLMQEGGSRIGEGVHAALEAFDPDSTRPRVLFVASDGEDPARGALGIDEVARSGVRVLAALFGSEAGATIPDAGAALHDVSGRVVVSRRELEPLGRLAAASDGRLLLADRWGEIDVAQALAALGRDRGSTPGERVARQVPAVRAAPLAGVAFVLLVLELVLAGHGRRRSRPALAATLGCALACLGAGSLRELEETVRGDPEDARALLALGVARAEAGDAEEAARAFFAAAAHAPDPELAALAYFDLGVAELSLGRLDAASRAFYDALALDPTDLEAKYNLEWTLREAREARASSGPRDPAPPEPSEPEPSQEERRAAEEASRRPERRVEPVGDLDPGSVERWLAQVPDEPAQALRDTARAERRRRPSSVEPDW